MLYITIYQEEKNASKDFTWHLGGDIVLPQLNLNSRISLQADGDELALIKAEYPSLTVPSARVQHFFGDAALHILFNVINPARNKPAIYRKLIEG